MKGTYTMTELKHGQAWMISQYCDEKTELLNQLSALKIKLVDLRLKQLDEPDNERNNLEYYKAKKTQESLNAKKKLLKPCVDPKLFDIEFSFEYEHHVAGQTFKGCVSISSYMGNKFWKNK